MMLNDVVQEAINRQINNELFSMYSYLSMSAYCEFQQFRGCAHWMRLQSQEEFTHATRLYDFLIARQARVRPGHRRTPMSSRSLRSARRTRVFTVPCGIASRSLTSRVLRPRPFMAANCRP